MQYRVQSGDSLYKIAQKYNLSVPEIKKANALAADSVSTGQILFLPVLPDGIYEKGALGEGVTEIQEVLYHLGFPVTIDGVYGPQTMDIILNLQKKLPELQDDGIYESKTRAFLKRLLYADYCIIKNPSSILALVNKKNALDSYYAPDQLVIPGIPFCIDGFDPKKQVSICTSSPLEALFSDAKKKNISLLGVSGYRSYTRQANLFKQKWLQTPADANRVSARPGESEHQTGLAMDVSSPAMEGELEDNFADTKEGAWLAENAYRFGFIIRYPKGKESITGYQYEPWHLRYVGKSCAKVLHESGKTLEEYLA